MKRKRLVLLLLSLPLLVAMLAGCRHQVHQSAIYSGCVVTKSWTDSDGKLRKECSCLNQKVIGLDAKTGAKIIRCQ